MEISEDKIILIFEWKEDTYKCPLCNLWVPFIERHIHLLSKSHDGKIRNLPKPEQRFAWRKLLDYTEMLRGPRRDFTFPVSVPGKKDRFVAVLRQLDIKDAIPPPLPSYILDLMQPDKMQAPDNTEDSTEVNNNNSKKDDEFYKDSISESLRWKEYYLNPYGKKESFSHLPKAHELTEEEELQIALEKSRLDAPDYVKYENRFDNESIVALEESRLENNSKEEESLEDFWKGEGTNEKSWAQKSDEYYQELVRKKKEEFTKQKAEESDEKLLQEIMERSRLEFESQDKQMLQFQLNAFEFQEKIKMPNVEDILACEKPIITGDSPQEKEDEQLKFVCIDE